MLIYSVLSFCKLSKHWGPLRHVGVYHRSMVVVIVCQHCSSTILHMTCIFPCNLQWLLKPVFAFWLCVSIWVCVWYVHASAVACRAARYLGAAANRQLALVRRWDWRRLRWAARAHHLWAVSLALVTVGKYNKWIY